MHVQFTLNSNHKLILSVLKEADNIDILRLRRVLISLHCGDISFSSLVDALSKDDFSVIPPFEVYGYFRNHGSERSVFENDVANLEYVGLVKLQGHPSPNIGQLFGRVRLTDEGKRIAKNIKENRQIILRPNPELRTSIFIACAFGYDEIDCLYQEQFIPACKSLNYTPIRVDMSEPTKTITDAIMNGIAESNCVIADLTYARPSVYFEVGYAHGLGIPILLTGRKDHYHGTDDKTRIHFDLEQYKISFWSLSGGKFTWNKGMNPKERLSGLVPKLKKLSKSNAANTAS